MTMRQACWFAAGIGVTIGEVSKRRRRYSSADVQALGYAVRVLAHVVHDLCCAGEELPVLKKRRYRVSPRHLPAGCRRQIRERWRRLFEGQA